MKPVIKPVKDEYDKEPVAYCKHCLSLNIVILDGDQNECYCRDCRSTNVGYNTIDKWIELKIQRGGY